MIGVLALVGLLVLVSMIMAMMVPLIELRERNLVGLGVAAMRQAQAGSEFVRLGQPIRMAKALMRGACWSSMRSSGC